MRKFYLRNEGGTTQSEYKLQYTDAFLWQPAGLGFSYDREYTETDGFYLKMNEVLSQTAKTGIIVFHGSDPYAEYKDFIDWITASKQLKLAYSTDDVTYYFIDIDIQYIDKSEIQLDGTLQCSISMMPTSPIYLIDSTEVEINGELPSNMKRYTYGYKPDPVLYDTYIGNSSTPVTDTGTEIPTIDGTPVTPNDGDYVSYSGTLFCWVGANWIIETSDEKEFWYTYSDTAVAGTITITPQAQLPCCFEIYTENPVSKPVLTFNDEQGNTFGKVDLSAISVGADEKLLYSSIPTSAGVTLTSGGITSDITNYLNISPQYPSFFTLPPKRTTSIVLSADSLVGVKIEIRVYRYFVSV